MRIWWGRIVGAVPVLFLAMDGAIHVAGIEPVLEAFRKLSLPENLALPLGLLELACLALYLFRATRFVGALLLTAYLGGAVAIHARAGSTLFEVLFPVILGAWLWLGYGLSEPRLRGLLVRAG